MGEGGDTKFGVSIRLVGHAGWGDAIPEEVFLIIIMSS
jgi:hypothetical protein